MKLIVGLGNPGKKYEHTRHNVGFLVIDELIKTEGAAPKTMAKFPAEVCKSRLNKKNTILAKPLTYMNNSGAAVAALLHFYRLKVNDLIVVHDDKDIPLGEMRVQIDRGSAGHNGVKSLIEHLKTQKFLRIRVGVAPALHTIQNTADFVLSKFTKKEQQMLKGAIANVIEEIKKIVSAT